MIRGAYSVSVLPSRNFTEQTVGPTEVSNERDFLTA
jgi:hypothetical protein